MRRAGILLHITSLPSDGPVGDFGPSAYEFIDFLADSKQGIWHILPLHPTHPSLGNSPYNPLSLFAGNKLFISAEILAEEGLLERKYIKPLPPTPEVDYRRAMREKENILKKAFLNFTPTREYEEFCKKNSHWLEDFATFEAISKKHGIEWHKWTDKIHVSEEEIEFSKFCQFIFFRQWFRLKEYANSKGVMIFGDMPIYPAYHSADVWSNPYLFKLDKDKKPKAVAGVPPDYFSSTGQLWGNPVYDWGNIKEDNFSWFVKRFIHLKKMYDYVRIDHFRGYIAYWEVPAGEKTALKGKWVRAPYEEFFKKILRFVDPSRLIAEDLGYITPDVKEVIRKFNIAGMRVLQFGFDEINSEHLPHNYPENCIAFTGTHDNPPLLAWFEKTNAKVKNNLFSYIGLKIDGDKINDILIRLLYMSKAKIVIVPIQDILKLSEDARINTPSKKRGNWKWRVEKKYLNTEVTAYLSEITGVYGR